MRKNGFVRILEQTENQLIAVWKWRGRKLRILLRLFCNENNVWGKRKALFGISAQIEGGERLLQRGVLVKGGDAEKVEEVRRNFALKTEYLDVFVEEIERCPYLETAFWRAIRKLEAHRDLPETRCEISA